MSQFCLQQIYSFGQCKCLFYILRMISIFMFSRTVESSGIISTARHSSMSIFFQYFLNQVGSVHHNNPLFRYINMKKKFFKFSIEKKLFLHQDHIKRPPFESQRKVSLITFPFSCLKSP